MSAKSCDRPQISSTTACKNCEQHADTGQAGTIIQAIAPCIVQQRDAVPPGATVALPVHERTAAPKPHGPTNHQPIPPLHPRVHAELISLKHATPRVPCVESCPTAGTVSSATTGSVAQQNSTRTRTSLTTSRAPAVTRGDNCTRAMSKKYFDCGLVTSCATVSRRGGTTDRPACQTTRRHNQPPV